MEFPKFVDTLEAATALNVSPRTICRFVGKPYDKHNTRVPFLGLCRAVKADPAWFAAVLRGEDRAASIAEAATVFGLSAPQMASTAHKHRIAKPTAMLAKGWRYSARELGLFDPPVSPLAGRPDGFVLGPNGWQEV